ncbi:hypothetical protein [Sinosporangium album]|nr:hypothetical protein [Sinosporangium album]
MVLADLYDAIGRLTQAAGRWRRKPPKVAPYPRPKARRRRVTTMADIKRTYLSR